MLKFLGLVSRCVVVVLRAPLRFRAECESSSVKSEQPSESMVHKKSQIFLGGEVEKSGGGGVLE